jgi:ribosomal protein L25 (general stress protein Ctc)
MMKGMAKADTTHATNATLMKATVSNSKIWLLIRAYQFMVLSRHKIRLLIRAYIAIAGEGKTCDC